MSNILATSEELSKIIERAVNRIGENHALARDNGGVTMNSSEIEEDRKEYRKEASVIEEALEDAAKDMAEKMVLEQNIDSIVKEQVKAIGGGSGFVGNQGGSDALAKFQKRQEMGEQEEMMCEKCGEVHEGTCGYGKEEEVDEATTASMAGAFVAPLGADPRFKKGVNESTKNTIKKLVRKKLNEVNYPNENRTKSSTPGYDTYETVYKESGKHNKEYEKDFKKKFEDYNDFTGNDNPKFPHSENSKLNADGQYQYYRNDETQDEYIEDWRGMGLEDADGVENIGRLSDYLEGSSETGNAQVDNDGTPLGNVVPNELGEKIKKKINRKKEKIEGQKKAMSNDKRYSPDVQKVKQVKEGVNVDIDKMKKLWSYNKKTQ